MILRLVLCFLISCWSLSLRAEEAEIVYLSDSQYQIKPYDQISMIKTKNKTEIETIFAKVPVLSNGFINIPGHGDLRIEGLTIKDLKRLYPDADFLIYHQNKYVAVIGEVMRPGVYPPENINTVYDAIASAGGFTRLSNKRKVKIVHQYKDGRREVFRINFPKDVFKAYDKGIGADKYLVHEGDLISVPKSRLKQFHSFVSNLFNTAVQVSTIGLISGAVSGALQ